MFLLVVLSFIVSFFFNIALYFCFLCFYFDVLFSLFSLVQMWLTEDEKTLVASQRRTSAARRSDSDSVVSTQMFRSLGVACRVFMGSFTVLGL